MFHSGKIKVHNPVYTTKYHTKHGFTFGLQTHSLAIAYYAPMMNNLLVNEKQRNSAKEFTRDDRRTN